MDDLTPHADQCYFVALDGKYLGAFSDGAEPAVPHIKISGPPAHGWQRYDLNTKKWLPLTLEDQARLMPEVLATLPESAKIIPVE